MPRFSVLGATAVLLLTAGACGNSDGELTAADIKTELSANFQSGGEFGELIQRTSESFSAGHPAKDSMNSIETC